MGKSTYNTEEVILEREVNKLYGMAIARLRNTAVKEEADRSFSLVISLLYRQWNREPSSSVAKFAEEWRTGVNNNES
jgi:hypothetical protein